MTSKSQAPIRGAFVLGAGRAALASVVAVTMLLVGCGDKKQGASQTAAKVNKEEITVHQINFVLQQQRGLKPEQADAASKQILERLIDQELALQKAQELKIDRDPRVVQQLEAARREIIARAYVEKSGDAATKPSADEIKKYFEAKPALFSDRRIYSIQELAVEARPEQIELLRTQLQGVKSINEFVDFLKANSFRFSANQAVKPAEQLPLNMLETFATMKDGQALLMPTTTGAQVVVLASSRAEPVDEARARPAIEQFLLNDAKRKLVEADLKAMRASAKIQYIGKFAEPAASAAMTPAIEPPIPPESVVPASAASDTNAPSSPTLDADSITKGMRLKKP